MNIPMDDTRTHAGCASHERETFLSGREVLDRIRGALALLGDHLQEQSQERVSHDLEATIEILEHERLAILTDTLSDFEQTTPKATLDRMQQYVTALPATLSRPPDTRSPHAIAAWMSAVIDRFGAAFDELAEGCESDRVSEPFHRMAVRMRAHARRIARISLEVVETRPPVLEVLQTDAAKHASERVDSEGKAR